MEEAANSVENSTSIAFGVRNEKSCLVEINKRLDDTNVAIAVPFTSRINLCELNCIEIRPSDILQDHAKVDLLFSTFNAKGKQSAAKFCDARADSKMLADILKKVDLLFVMLSSYFQTNVKRKV
jgi:hypothetical protein